jgi:hypothetical protein
MEFLFKIEFWESTYSGIQSFPRYIFCKHFLLVYSFLFHFLVIFERAEVVNLKPICQFFFLLQFVLMWSKWELFATLKSQTFSSMSSARSFIVSGWFCPDSQVWVEVILHMDGQMLWHFLLKTALLYWTASALWLKTNGPHDRVSF